MRRKIGWALGCVGLMLALAPTASAATNTENAQFYSGDKLRAESSGALIRLVAPNPNPDGIYWYDGYVTFRDRAKEDELCARAWLVLYAADGSMLHSSWRNECTGSPNAGVWMVANGKGARLRKRPVRFARYIGLSSGAKMFAGAYDMPPASGGYYDSSSLWGTSRNWFYHLVGNNVRAWGSR